MTSSPTPAPHHRAEAAARALSGRPIVVRGLSKSFGGVKALNGLDLEVESGTVHGFLGPNGSGKSTTIRTLLGLYRPESGIVRVLGRDPVHHSPAINKDVSYVPGDVALWPGLTGGQVLDAIAGLRGRRDLRREAELIERFELDPSKKVRTYSTGNRQKVALIAALAAPTSLLILDEPTSGLDPLMERVFTQEIASAAAAGRSVLLSSHILAEVQRLCSAVTIIKDGRAVESGDLGTLRRLSRTRITVRADRAELEAICADWTAIGVQARPGQTGQTRQGVAVAQVDAAAVPRVLGVLARRGAEDVTCQAASLEDLFLRHYQEER